MLGTEWRQYEQTFPVLAESTIDQVSIEVANSRVPLELLELLGDKGIQVGAIDVATDQIETAEDVAGTLERVMRHVPPERIVASTNCGLVPLDRGTARGKLRALGACAALVLNPKACCDRLHRVRVGFRCRSNDHAGTRSRDVTSDDRRVEASVLIGAPRGRRDPFIGV